jgi:hypothetical protein
MRCLESSTTIQESDEPTDGSTEDGLKCLVPLLCFILYSVCAVGSAVDRDMATIGELGCSFAAVNGLERFRQAGRDVVFDGVPMPFCFDAVGILGVALGTMAVADADVTNQVVQWTTKFLRISHERNQAEDWHRCLFAAADRQLGGHLNLSIPKSAATADVRTAMLAKGLIDAADQAPEDTVQTLELAAQEPPKDFAYDRGALRLAAVDYLNRCGTSGLVVQDGGAEAPGGHEGVGPTAGSDVVARAARRQAVVNPILQEKRWKRGRLVTEAGVGKNSVYQYEHANPSLAYQNAKIEIRSTMLRVKRRRRRS